MLGLESVEITTWIFKAGSEQLPAFWFGIRMAIKRVWVGWLCGMELRVKCMGGVLDCMGWVVLT